MHVNTINRTNCQCPIHPLSNDIKIAALSCIFAPKIAILPGWAKISFADKWRDSAYKLDSCKTTKKL